MWRNSKLGLIRQISVGWCRLTPGTPWFSQLSLHVLSKLETEQ